MLSLSRSPFSNFLLQHSQTDDAMAKISGLRICFHYSIDNPFNTRSLKSSMHVRIRVSGQGFLSHIISHYYLSPYWHIPSDHKQHLANKKQD